MRYYLAFSEQAVAAADAHPDLTPIATSGPWHVYEIADSDLVSPLSYEPAVVDGVEDAIHSWLPMAVDWYQDPSQWDVPLASSGPDEWPRVEAGQEPERVPVTPVTVTDITSDDDGISFDVENLKFAAFDQDQSLESRQLVEAFSSSRYFEERPPIRSAASPKRRSWKSLIKTLAPSSAARLATAKPMPVPAAAVTTTVLSFRRLRGVG